MILSICVILAVLLVAYVHFVRGFFSGVLSAICAVVAAVLAFSLHETIVENYLGGKMANSAHALVLLALFPAIYIVLRTIFDKAVPGQIRLPATLDKVGGAVMGLVAGVFAAGIIVIAAEELPFGASIGGYSRYAVADRTGINIPGTPGRSDRTGTIYDELKSDNSGTFDAAQVQGLLLPVDDVVVGAVKYLSDGSLAGAQTLDQVHPDFLQESFGQRIGIEAGAKRVALNLDKQQLHAVTVKGIYSLSSIQQGDAEFKTYRPAFAAKYTGQLKPGPEQSMIVVRVMFSTLAADEDGLVRFSPGSIRLVTPSTENDVTNFVDYYPIGTLQGTTQLYRNKPDDPLFVSVGQHDAGADLVFLVHTRGAFQGVSQGLRKFAPGSFIEVKRLGREDLSGRSVETQIVGSPDVAVLRKITVAAAPAPSKPVSPEPVPPKPDPVPGPAPVPTPAPTPKPPATGGPVFDTK